MATQHLGQKIPPSALCNRSPRISIHRWGMWEAAGRLRGEKEGSEPGDWCSGCEEEGLGPLASFGMKRRPVVRYRPVFLMGPWATYWMYEGLHGNLMGHLLDGKKQANLSDSVGFNGLRKPHNIYLQQQCPPCKPERNPGTCGSGSWVNLGLSGDCTHK